MLQWRRGDKIDSILTEDYSDLDHTREIYWAGTDRDGAPTLVWRVFLHRSGAASAQRPGPER